MDALLRLLALHEILVPNVLKRKQFCNYAKGHKTVHVDSYPLIKVKQQLHSPKLLLKINKQKVQIVLIIVIRNGRIVWKHWGYFGGGPSDSAATFFTMASAYENFLYDDFHADITIIRC